jgi:hypothetical protein
MDEILSRKKTAFRRGHELKARAQAVANRSECAIRAKRHHRPDLNKFIAYLANTPPGL